MNTTDFAVELINLAKRLMSILEPRQRERSKKLGKMFLRSMRKGEYNGAEMSLALITVLLAQIQPVIEQESDEDNGEVVKPKQKKGKKRK